MILVRSSPINHYVRLSKNRGKRSDKTYKNINASMPERYQAVINAKGMYIQYYKQMKTIRQAGYNPC